MRRHCHTYLTTSFVALSLLVALATPGAAETPSPLETRFHAFANGLGLYHVKVKEATNFMLSMTVWVGSVDEDQRTNGGVSHLLEHILFHQPDMPEEAFNAQIKSRGGSYNGRTSRDYTRYHVTLPRAHLALGQAWLYKVLFHDRLVTSRLEDEKEIVNRENGWSPPTWWHQVGDLIDPKYLALPGFWTRQFGLREYDQPVGGTYEVAGRLTAAQLEAHYRAYYYPENMVLLYVGPHDFEQVVAVTEARYGRVAPTGRKPHLRSLVQDQSPRPYFAHKLPQIFSEPDYRIAIGQVLTGLHFSSRSEMSLYYVVMKELLEQRFRYGEGKTYAVWGYFDHYRGAGYLQFELEASRETFWTQLREVKELVWGDLGSHLSRADYERYRTTLLERVTSSRALEDVHGRVWGAIYHHPSHRPSPEETDIAGPWRSFTYDDFLKWARSWRGDTARLLELSMPGVPFPYSHLVVFVLFLAIGTHWAQSLLRRPYPREPIALITRVPYRLAGWVHLGLVYAVVACVYFHLSRMSAFGGLVFSRLDLLALLGPYLRWAFDGILIGFGIVVGGTLIPREALATDGALVVTMRSPVFIRIPLTDIERVEPLSGWAAWKQILRLKVLPVYPWFFRGVIIHRKSGRSLVLHTQDDHDLRELLSARVLAEPAVPISRAARTTRGRTRLRKPVTGA
jgi:predicted Zn-dependent peptidase